MINYPKILYLLSAPLVALDGSPLDALDMKAEKDAIIHELSTCKKEISLRIGVATVDELARSIAEEFNILHVSSHGHEEFLLFEDGKGGSQAITGDYLKRFIQMGGPFELAIVSACHSEKIAALLVEAGIPHVVGIKCDVRVLDRAVIVFAGQFLRSLFQGASVQKAFEMAQLLVEGNPDLMRIKRHLEFTAYKRREPFVPEEKKFVLLPERSTHKDHLLSEVPQGTVTVEEPAPSPSNLPVKPRSFTGRSVEMHAIICGLFENRFVTITGVGGIGKTTLAIEAARWFSSRSHFSDGIFYIDLRQTDTADGVIDLLGAALDVEFSELEDVIAYLRERHCLLLLDNAEDILWQDEDAMQHIINSILRFTLNTVLLITSQRPIEGNLYEPERVYRLYSLEQHYAALLFGATTKRRILLKERESDTFHVILEQLGGHPLSIVLTARQLAPGITLEDILERINVYKAKAIKIKNITDRDLEHGESLVASLASAYYMLSDKAKTLLEILSMLPAGAKKNTLTRVYDDTAWGSVQELNDASLVEIRHRRATLLPPVRLFAMSILTDEVKNQYGPKIVELMKVYARKLYEHHSKKDAKAYRLYFTADEPNLRSAADLPCAPPQTDKEPSALGYLAPYLISLYDLHSRHKEAKEVGDKIIANLGKLQDRLGEATTLNALGNLAMWTGDLEEAETRYRKALKIFQHINNNLGEANMLMRLGELCMRAGDLEEAETRYRKALKIFQHIKRKLGEANTLMRLGELCMWTGDLEEAETRYRKALEIFQHIKRNLDEANTLMRLGDLCVRAGDLEEAETRYRKALKIYQRIDEKSGEAWIFIRLAQWAALTDELDRAESNLDNAFTIFREIEDPYGQADAHMAKAFIFLKHHNTSKAKYELDRCSSIQDKVGAHYEAAHWLLFYAIHLKLNNFQKGAKLCLKYAEEFALTARNQYLQNQVEQELSEIA